MISDYHLHSSFSGDSEATPESMIQKAVSLGMKQMCFTDHYDMDYPDEPELFLFDVDKYFETMRHLKEQYKATIKLCIGIELGLQKHLAPRCADLIQQYPFDFVIGSTHVVNHMDPYYPEYFEGRMERDCYEQFFQEILDNLNVFQDYDVCGHLDYIVRYGPDKNKFYSYPAYREILDDIIKTCVHKGVGLEINTGGIAYGLGTTNPHPDILKRYRELGGEIITVGSDAHTPERLAFEFKKAHDILLACGFRYYSVFENRKPVYIPL